METLIEQVVMQFPVVMLMLYLFKGREDRINTLEKRVDDCLDNKAQKTSKGDNTYTYP